MCSSDLFHSHDRLGDKKEKVVEKDANGKKSVAHRHGVNKAQMGHFKKAGVSGKRFVREFKFENADEYNLADEIKADIFAEGDKVDVTAISKGKGFQGAIKRLGQHRGPMATAGDGVAHIAHLGGMVVGFFMIKYWRSHAYRGSNMSDGNQFFDNLKRKWDQRGNKKKFKTWHNKNTEPESYNSHNNDWDYNARKKAEQDEIDRILDKIRKSGYDSLSADEKRCLFESSKKN